MRNLSRTIDDYPKPRPISEAEKAMVAEGARRRDEAQLREQPRSPRSRSTSNGTASVTSRCT
jgi:hypothetical protein